MNPTPTQHIPNKNIDYSQLDPRQMKLLHELSGFSFQTSFLSLLKKQYGDTNLKEKFIDSNKNYMDLDDVAVLNQQALKYKRQTLEGSTLIISTCTLGALVLGIARLPARKSPFRYTVGGFALGVGVSYAFWRLQLNKYDKKVNQIFRKIVKEKYEENHGNVVE